MTPLFDRIAAWLLAEALREPELIAAHRAAMKRRQS